MIENFTETQNSIKQSNKFIKFYKENKILVFSILSMIIITIASFSFYFETKEKKRIILADNYIEAKTYLENGEKNKATKSEYKIV